MAAFGSSPPTAYFLAAFVILFVLLVVLSARNLIVGNATLSEQGQRVSELQDLLGRARVTLNDARVALDAVSDPAAGGGSGDKPLDPNRVRLRKEIADLARESADTLAGFLAEMRGLLDRIEASSRLSADQWLVVLNNLLQGMRTFEADVGELKARAGYFVDTFGQVSNRSSAELGRIADLSARLQTVSANLAVLRETERPRLSGRVDDTARRITINKRWVYGYQLRCVAYAYDVGGAKVSPSFPSTNALLEDAWSRATSLAPRLPLNVVLVHNARIADLAWDPARPPIVDTGGDAGPPSIAADSQQRRSFSLLPAAPPGGSNASADGAYDLLFVSVSAARFRRVVTSVDRWRNESVAAAADTTGAANSDTYAAAVHLFRAVDAPGTPVAAGISVCHANFVLRSAGGDEAPTAGVVARAFHDRVLGPMMVACSYCLVNLRVQVLAPSTVRPDSLVSAVRQSLSAAASTATAGRLSYVTSVLSGQPSVFWLHENPLYHGETGIPTSSTNTAGEFATTVFTDLWFASYVNPIA